VIPLAAACTGAGSNLYFLASGCLSQFTFSVRVVGMLRLPDVAVTVTA